MKIGHISLGLVLLAAVVGGVTWRVGNRAAPSGSATISPRPVALTESVGRSSPPSEPMRSSSSPLPPAPLANSALSREEQLRETARFWARADLPATATWLLTLSDADAAIATDAVLAEIGQDDVPAAIVLAQALRRGVDDGRVEHMAQIWTEETPNAAVAWISSLAPGADRDRLLARAALVRVGHDPAEAARLLGAMTDGSTRDTAVAAAIARLRMYDPAKADTWEAVLAKPRSG